MFIWFNLIVYWLAVFFIAPVTSDQKPINAIQLIRIKKHMWIISVAVTILCVIGTLASKGLKLSYMLSLVSILVAISIFATSMMTGSYTHLDVYKRQGKSCAIVRFLW